MKREDIHKVLIIGSGPIIIGQACEFDSSGTPACKALKNLGYEIVLVNSNPATIMTDPDTADITYIEPLNVCLLYTSPPLQARAFLRLSLSQEALSCRQYFALSAYILYILSLIHISFMHIPNPVCKRYMNTVNNTHKLPCYQIKIFTFN